MKELPAKGTLDRCREVNLTRLWKKLDWPTPAHAQFLNSTGFVQDLLISMNIKGVSCRASVPGGTGILFLKIERGTS